MKIFQNKKAQNKEEKKDIIIETTTEELKPEITPEDVIIEEIKEEEVQKPIVKKDKKSVAKTLCRVIVATPSYFVINKNGEKITINEANNYQRGQDIEY